MITADNITDEQIRELRDDVFSDVELDEVDRAEMDLLEYRALTPRSCTDDSWVWCDDARSLMCLGCGRVARRPSRGSPKAKHRSPNLVGVARARCAELLNQRAKAVR